MPDVPSFGGSGVEKAREIATWVDARLKPAKMHYWDLLKLGVQSPEEILGGGKFFAAFGCLEKAAVLAALLEKNGFETQLVFQKGVCGGKAITVHFMAESAWNGFKFSLNPGKLVTRFHEGWFSEEPRASRNVVFHTVLVKKIEGDPMKKRAFSLCGIRGRRHFFALSGMGKMRFLRFARESMKLNKGSLPGKAHLRR